nr:hypothetical protein [Tanacetum cinerariifolium]
MVSNEIKNAMSSFFQMQSPSGSGSLSSNTIANPRGDLKAITTRSGVAYDGPTIPPTPSPLPKEVNVKPRRQRTRLNDQKFCEKANNQMMKFLEIFQRLHFDISFADALLHMPKFASTFKSLLSNKEKLFELPKLEECLALADLGASINLIPLFLWKKLSLLELTSTRMTLELANRSIVIPTGVAEDVFVKVRKFYFPADFVVVDYDIDPRVPLILKRPFLRTARALIDVHVNVIDVACEEYAQEVLGFLDSSTSGNPTLSDPIIASSSLSFTPFKGSDFILEEIETFLRTPDQLTNLHDDYYDTEEDILYLEKLLNEDPSTNLPSLKNDDLKQVDATMTKPSIEEPLELELKDLPSHLEYTLIYPISDSPWVSPVHCMPKKGGMTVIENEDNELIPTRLVTGWHVCIDYHKLNDATRKDHFSLHFMDQMLERLTGNEYYCFVDGFSGYFQIPIDSQDQEKTTFTFPYGTFAYRRMPFGLCNTPGTFQRCMMAIFHDMIEETMEPIHYASKTVTDAQARYTTTEEELLAVVYAFEKFHPYLVLSKTIVYTNHSALKYLLAKQDAKPRLENPHQGDLEKKEINETFPLETLGMVASRIANYHAGNFVVKGMSSQ